MSRASASHFFRLSRPSNTSSALRACQTQHASHLRHLPARSRLYSSHPQRTASRTAPTIAAAIGATTIATWVYLNSAPPLRADAPPPASTPSTYTPPPSDIKTAPPEDSVPTGNSTIPFFPRHLKLPPSPTSTGPHKASPSASLPAGLGAAEATDEYFLLGLGLRTVSILRIKVYVVGIYICKADLHKLQAAMIKAVAGEGASTLVENEKSQLRRMLVDGEGSAKVWGGLLREEGIRGALRIVPTRDTNMGHMRDGFVRMVNAGAGKEGVGGQANFEQSVVDFKGVMGGGSVKKGRVLLLGRGEEGNLGAWVEGEEGMRWIGGVKDERVGRYLWMGYLGGEKVATESARESVVEGVVELVERPIGTVETQVV